MQTTVYCSLEVEGLHRWPTCNLEQVMYLRFLHRHMFHIKCYVNVTHGDRDVEFIDLKHQVAEYLQLKYYDPLYSLHNFDDRSCEHLAVELMNEFNLVKCEVSEDGENGAIVEL